MVMRRATVETRARRRHTVHKCNMSSCSRLEREKNRKRKPVVVEPTGSVAGHLNGGGWPEKANTFGLWKNIGKECQHRGNHIENSISKFVSQKI